MPNDLVLQRSIATMYSYIGCPKMEMGQTDVIWHFAKAFEMNQNLLRTAPENRQ